MAAWRTWWKCRDVQLFVVPPTMDFDLLIVLYDANGELGRTETEHRDLPADPTVMVSFPRELDGDPRKATNVRMEITELSDNDVHNIHVREVSVG